jgi:hypothetical protein
MIPQTDEELTEPKKEFFFPQNRPPLNNLGKTTRAKQGWRAKINMGLET